MKQLLSSNPMIFSILHSIWAEHSAMLAADTEEAAEALLPMSAEYLPFLILI